MNNEELKIDDVARRLLNEVDQSIAVEQAPEPAPGEGDSSAPAVHITMEEAEMMSIALVAAAANWAETYHPALEGRYPDEVRAQVVARLAPVVKKYDGALPPWLLRYQEEIMLAICLSGIVYGSIRAVREYRAPTPESAGLTS